jgi:hypothetical protein
MGEYKQIPFMVHDGNEYSLCADALDLVSLLPYPVSVCTVFGAPGSGKTTLIRHSIILTDSFMSEDEHSDDDKDIPSHEYMGSCPIFWL